MALSGRGVLGIWHGIAAEAEAEFWRWHDGEHIPERLGVPGFRRGRRYRHVATPLRYLDFYEVDDPGILESAPYLARLNAPSPWTRTVVPFFRGTERFGFRVVSTEADGQAGLLVTARLRPTTARTPGPELAREVRQLADDPPALLAVHVLEAVEGATRIVTAERRLRSQQVTEPDSAPDPWLILAECTDEPTALAVQQAAFGPAGLRSLGVDAAAARIETYRLQITMDPG